jgi:hypothetical protein
MSRHAFNLEHLCNKLQTRYGAQDPFFLQVKRELDIFKVKVAMVSMHHDWGVSYRKLVSDHNSEFMQRGKI